MNSRATLLVTTDNRRYPVNNTLDELEEMLNPKQFTRANRQFIITFEAIQIDPGQNRMLLRSGSNTDRRQEFIAVMAGIVPAQNLGIELPPHGVSFWWGSPFS